MHNLSSLLCEDLKAVVISVECVYYFCIFCHIVKYVIQVGNSTPSSYRLAPEYTYPTPMDDCFKVTKYVLNHAGEFNIDPSRVSIAGES